MQVQALRNIITKQYGPIPTGQVVEVPTELGKLWISAKAAAEYKDPKAETEKVEEEKPKAPVREKAVNPPKSEKAVR